MNYSELEDEMSESTVGEGSPLSDAIYEQVQATTTPPIQNGYDPYLLAIRIISILFGLCLLFVAAIYYGVINP